MAKSLLKKAKKAAKKVKKTVEKEVKIASSSSSSAKSKVSDIRAHVEKLAGERRDCAVIARLLLDTDKYKTDEDIKNLCKFKGYDTLLGEIS
jgi:hypothetical protein